MSSATPTPTRVRRLPVVGPLRLGRPSDVWFKPALSVVAAVAVPSLLLMTLGRLDLAPYTMAGSLCALYAHNRPYAARAKVLAWVILGMLGGLAVALVSASLTRNAVVLVTVGALLAAAQKAVCDATRVGPPAHVILTFVSSATLFVPQTLGQVPGHLALAAAAGAWAWLVGMAPAPLRPHGPERRATAQALNAAATYAETARGGEEGAGGARSAAYAAVHAAWQTLLAVRDRPSTTRRALERLVVRAEVALAAPADADPARLRAWARAVRGTGRIPRTGDPRREDEGLRLNGADARADGADARLDSVDPRPDGANPRRAGGGARLGGADPRVDDVDPRVDGTGPCLDGAEPRRTAGGGSRRDSDLRLDGADARVDGTAPRLDGVDPRPDGTGPRLDGVGPRRADGGARLDGSNPCLGGADARGDGADARPEGANPRRADGGACLGGTDPRPQGANPRRTDSGARLDGAGSRRAHGGARLGGDGTRRDDDRLRERDELVGVAAERAVAPPPLWSRLGPLAPVAVRSALGCALAGYVSLALGADRPYWALVTAASLYQANITLTWSRAVQRVVGNLVGVLLFAAVTPVAQLGPLALVLCILACNFGAEALIGRNYWLGSVCVTPLALLVTELPGYQPTGELVTGRVVDTLVGALVGFVAALAVTNRRAGRRVERALTAVDRAREHAARLAADPMSTPAALEAARRGLAAAVVDLRATADAAAGEWWQRALPQERVVLAEQAAHRTLAATVRRQGLLPDPGTTSTYTHTEGASP
ncbi:FUSC family protein [Actinospica acidiphila]|uniref:FUSC family protein n=1 Tax=Actinospica acidiphila TaxID=304899 RepID=UPI00193F171F|nr:FUSC family protein [Actinospica acidiphila]